MKDSLDYIFSNDDVTGGLSLLIGDLVEFRNYSSSRSSMHFDNYY